MINFASGMLWESTFAEHGWYGMNQHELTELLCLTIFANSWTWRWRSRLTWQSRKSMLHLLHKQAAVIDLLSLLCILWSVCLIAPRYVTEVPCLSCLGAMVQFLGSRMRRKNGELTTKIPDVKLQEKQLLEINKRMIVRHRDLQHLWSNTPCLAGLLAAFHECNCEWPTLAAITEHGMEWKKRMGCFAASVQSVP